MAKYNAAKKYNMSNALDGVRYNTKVYVFIVKIGENIYFLENIELPLVQLILKEQLNLIEANILNVEHFLKGYFSLSDETVAKISTFFYLNESFNLLDTLSDFLAEIQAEDEYKLLENIEQFADMFSEFSFGTSDKVDLEVFLEFLESFNTLEEFTEFLAFLKFNENYNVSEKLELFAQLFSEFSFNTSDKVDLEAFIEESDKFEFTELLDLFSKMSTFDTFNITDRQPKNAISDFYVTKDENGICDIIKPFNLIVDYSKTKISFMPEAVDTISELVGTDGEIVQDTVYRSRMFDIYAVTEQGLTPREKEEIKREISEILHSVKTGTKVITFANNETEFDVKYTGLADIATDAPGWIRFQIPLKSPNAYGRKQFYADVKGSGLMVNTGVIPVGPLVKITGYCAKPAFIIGDVNIEWTGTVKEKETLYIDMQNETVYLVDTNGKKINAMKQFKGEFKKIPVGSIVLQASANTEDHIWSTWTERVLY